MQRYFMMLEPIEPLNYKATLHNRYSEYAWLDTQNLGLALVHMTTDLLLLLNTVSLFQVMTSKWLSTWNTRWMGCAAAGRWIELQKT